MYKYSKHLVRRKLHLIFIVNKYFLLFVLVIKLIILQLIALSRGKRNIFVTNCKDCNINHQYSLHISLKLHKHVYQFVLSTFRLAL